MYNRNLSRIEFSPELLPLLEVLAEKGNSANTVILYKYIDEADLEGTELLDLLSKSQMVKNNKDNFYNNVLNKNWSKKIQELISGYETGDLDIDNIKLKELKKKIKVLRFNEYYEKGNKNNLRRYNFDYTKRPQKYLVLSDDILDETYKKGQNGSNQIKEEGITSYICRTEKHARLIDLDNKKNGHENTIFSNEILKNNPAHCHYSNQETDFKIYGHDAAWIILKKEGNVIGCLRFEYNQIRGSESIRDNSCLDREKKITNISSNDKDLDLIINIIEKVLQNRKDFSYSELYRCLNPILEEIVKIGLKLRKDFMAVDEDNDMIKDIHSMIEHLYYVFKRNTYYGEAIYDRINKFIEELLKKLRLNEKIFLELWNSLRKQEDLMLYDLENYRDHFIHQFHVFVTGYIFIHNYGIDKLRILLNKVYNKHIVGNDNIANNQKEFTKIDVLRIWTLTSLFHDCGYSFEKLSKGLETFSENIIKVKLDSNFRWDKMILDDNYISESLKNIAKYYNCCPKKHSSFSELDLFKILLKKAIIRNDHGVISSIILKQQYKSCNMENEIPFINFIIDISALSIAIHNSPIFSSLSKEYNQNICFEQNPFAFILAYFDTVQEWGRKKSDKQNILISPPELKSIQFSDMQYNMTLKYVPSKDGRRPDREFINSKLNDVKNSFMAPFNMLFSINHNIGSPNEMTEFKNCYVSENCMLEK